MEIVHRHLFGVQFYSKMYHLVEYTDDHELAVIPHNWLDGNHCAVWPPFKSNIRTQKAVMNREAPGKEWKAYPIRSMYTSGKITVLIHYFYSVTRV